MSNDNEKQHSLLGYVDELVEKLCAMVPQAIHQGDESAIHQARVATRRLKAVTDVFQPVSSKTHRKEFVKVLSKLRRTLGPARDIDVMLGHLRELNSLPLKPGVGWLIEQLTAEQQKSRQLAEEKMDVAKVMSRLGSWWGIRQEWVETGDAELGFLIAESLHLQLDRFIEHADAVAGAVETGGVGVKSKLLLRDPHQLRITGKALRYTLELAIGGGHDLPVAVTRSFKRMQDALGFWHDYVVLSDCTLKLSLKSGIGFHDAAVQRVVLDVAKAMVLKSQRKLATFSRLWNFRGQFLATTIRKAFPLTMPIEPLSKLKVDLDPTGLEPSAEMIQVTSASETSTG